MPIYKQKYDIVDQGLTPLEEAALAHVLCSPETTYGDVARQMFVVQAIVSEAQFDLFQELSAKGANVTKCPRSGRPAKKLFRFSFVEGNIYLTWKGKYGNQGVDLGEVSREEGVVTEGHQEARSIRAGRRTASCRSSVRAGRWTCASTANPREMRGGPCWTWSCGKREWAAVLRVALPLRGGLPAGHTSLRRRYRGPRGSPRH